MERAELEELLRREDRVGLCAAARERSSRVLRFLVGRLYREDRSRAVRALGWLAADRTLTSEHQLVELMRRFVWAMNDESGAVPFGIAEAMGELMAQRAELTAVYLPILCSMITSAEMDQTGVIERGVVWALGRVGAAVGETCPEAIDALEGMARTHSDVETRQAARAALTAIAELPSSVRG